MAFSPALLLQGTRTRVNSGMTRGCGTCKGVVYSNEWSSWLALELSCSNKYVSTAHCEHSINVIKMKWPCLHGHAHPSVPSPAPPPRPRALQEAGKRYDKAATFWPVSAPTKMPGPTSATTFSLSLWVSGENSDPARKTMTWSIALNIYLCFWMICLYCLVDLSLLDAPSSFPSPQIII